MQRKSAFTFVELIVSVTIVSLLGAIGFIGFTSYLSSVRDTSRTAHLVEIYDTLIEKNISGTLPMPDDYIEITSNGKVIGYQGYVGEKVLSSLGLPETISDPKDETYYSYYLSKNKKYSEIMAFLEDKRDGKEVTFFETITPTFNTQIDYQERYPVVYGNKLGILTTKSNQPIQAIESIQTAGTLDILNTNEELVARLENDMWGSGTGSNLSQLEALSKKGGKNCSADGEKIECITGEGLPPTDWRAQDSNCDIPDITIGTQTWAGCNSTLGNGTEWGQTDADIGTSNYNGLLGLCYDYSGNSTGICPKGDSSMSSNSLANLWFSGVNVNGDSEFGNIWGKFYIGIETPTACGTGYHVPSNTEWNTLESYLTSNNGSTNIGWILNSTKNDTNNIAQALKITLSGTRGSVGNLYSGRGATAYFWSSSSPFFGYMYSKGLSSNNTAINTYTHSRSYGYSVRCIID